MSRFRKRDGGEVLATEVSVFWDMVDSLGVGLQFEYDENYVN